MPVYKYAALDRVGKTIKGVISADSQREAGVALRSRDLFPTDIQESKQDSGAKERQTAFLTLERAQVIKQKDLTLISRQMATMIGAGISVDDTLQSIAAQNDNEIIKEVLGRVRSLVLEGKRLSEALASEPRSFNKLFVAMVAAGEASGDLGRILDRAAEYAEKSGEVKSKVQAAMIYPLVLATVALAVLVMLITVVVPRVAVQFENFGQELPLITRIVVGISDGLSVLGVPLLIVILLLGLGLRRVMQRANLRTTLDRHILGLGFLGKFIQTVGSAQFARTLGTLIDGGSPMLEAIRAAQATQTNLHLREAVSQVASTVMEGGSLGSALQSSGAFSPLLVYMVAMGEKSGQLSNMLIKSADYLEQEIDNWTRSLLNLLEPVIVVVMGLVVGFIVMAIMLPILQLNSLVLN